LLAPVVFATAQTALKEAFEQHRGHCGAYMFMPNHLHLIVSGSCAESDLLAMVSIFKQKTTFRVRQTGVVFAWQKDFYDHIIRKTDDYGAQVRYILRNPVRRGLVERWEDWQFRGVLGQTWEQLVAAISTY
jgi:putative transposase